MPNSFPAESVSQLLAKALTANNHPYSAAIQQQWVNYLSLLYRWNQVSNLTAIRDPHEMVFQHLLDSLTVLPYLNATRCIDVGSGAGLPGIPLAIARPDIEFFLLDSNNKKTRFLQQVALELGLKNITVIHARCEAWKPDFAFDQVITRAFASLKTMLLATAHLLSPTGEFLAMKGVYPEEEIKEIPAQFKLIAVEKLNIVGREQQRCLVRIKPA